MSMHFPFLFFYRFCINDLYVYGISLGEEEEEVVKDAVQNLFLKIYFEEIRFRLHLFSLICSLKLNSII